MRAITNSIVLAALAAASTVTAKPSEEKPPAIEPAALDALRKMSGFLTEQKSFTIKTETHTDYVLDNGQKVRMEAKGDLRVQRPSKLYAELKSDRKDREFFYDGKTFTMFSPKIGYYTRVPAPATIGELADELQDRYGLELPLVDLFRWSRDEKPFADITSATLVGPTEIDGVKVDQYAFRQPGLDWQIWIEQGDKPLPRKLLLTTTDDPARPEHEIDMAWHLGATIQDKEFAFTPPKNAVRIGIADLRAPADAGKSAKRSARRNPGGTP